MDKIEVSRQFIRFMEDLATEAKRLAADYARLSTESKDRADNPRENDINTPQSNMANSSIFKCCKGNTKGRIRAIFSRAVHRGLCKPLPIQTR